MSVIISDYDYYLEIHNDEVFSDLMIDSGGYVWVLEGGTLTDSLMKDDGSMIVVDPGGIVQNTSATEKGWIYLNGSGVNLTAEDSAQLTIGDGGTLDKGLVKNNAVGNVFSSASVISSMVFPFS